MERSEGEKGWKEGRRGRERLSWWQLPILAEAEAPTRVAIWYPCVSVSTVHLMTCSINSDRRDLHPHSFPPHPTHSSTTTTTPAPLSPLHRNQGSPFRAPRYPLIYARVCVSVSAFMTGACVLCLCRSLCDSAWSSRHNGRTRPGQSSLDRMETFRLK
ncbi:hypothetical protein PoB_000228500 [Plakobranchus ocellatus]|uniref:Uncharacterized protein n=1 Tax=Plakobranchus ocellatus TaxID=259542 RepID=A0AAV3XYR5_9GAST|nr:hypothetical protein PoB_000228500 [Plakobranchus ocellatus]